MKRLSRGIILTFGLFLAACGGRVEAVSAGSGGAPPGTGGTPDGAGGPYEPLSDAGHQAIDAATEVPPGSTDGAATADAVTPPRDSAPDVDASDADAKTDADATADVYAKTDADATADAATQADAASCVSETNSELCLSFGRMCGAATIVDRCGRERTVQSCGSCALPEVCAGLVTLGMCGAPFTAPASCVPETDAALCRRYGKNCGAFTGLDNCGHSRTVASCGQCAAPCTCGADGFFNTCGGADGCAKPDGPSSLPFAVDQWFGMNGMSGDGRAEVGCPMSAPAAVPGSHCWTARYLQFENHNYDDGSTYWLFPVEEAPVFGRALPAGASRISLYAWGAKGGETIQFGAGNDDSDGFRVSITVTLTTVPTRYEIPLSGVSYRVVNTGFFWYSSQLEPATFFIDAIEWQ
jgi:hypothetical protein